MVVVETVEGCIDRQHHVRRAERATGTQLCHETFHMPTRLKAAIQHRLL